MAEKVFNEDFATVLDQGDNFDINDLFAKNVTDVVAKEEEDISEKGDGKEVKEDKKDTSSPEEKELDVNTVLSDQKNEEDKKAAIQDKKTSKEDKKEEDKDIEDTKEKGPLTKSKDDSPSSTSSFTVIFARDLSERDLLSSYDEEKVIKDVEEHGEAEALRNLIKDEIGYNVNSIKKTYDEGYQQYIDLVEGGTDADAAADLMSMKESLSSITEDDLKDENNIDLRKDILSSLYSMTTDLSDERIKKMVDKSFDVGDDVSDAVDAYKELNNLVNTAIQNEKDNAAQREAAVKEENQRQLTVLKETVDSLNEIIPGQKINSQTKDKIYKDITEPVKDKQGNVVNRIWAKRTEDPFAFDSKLAYLLETGFFDGGGLWKKIMKTKITKEATALEDYLSKNTKKTAGIVDRSVEEKDRLKDIIQSTASILK